MRIKLSELKAIINEAVLEHQNLPQDFNQANLDYSLRDLAKQIFSVARSFKTMRGWPDEQLAAKTLQLQNTLQPLLVKNKPEYVYLKALENDLQPLVQASSKFGKPAFLGKDAYKSNNLAAAEQLIKQLQRFKREVLDKQTSDLVGYEKE